MTYLQAMFLAVMQGITELFPVSSLAHAVILPRLLGWNVDQASAAFLPFVVALHIGTALAALVYFRRDWLAMGAAVLGRGEGAMVRRERRMLVMIMVATLPAVILALLFEKKIKLLFATPVIAAGVLMLNGVLMWVGERRRRNAGHRRLDEMSWLDAVWVGLWQSTALIPGVSRSGATMVAGLLTGFSHEASARFSFLIATPIILGAGVHELPKLLHHGMGDYGRLAVVAGLTAGVTAFLSIWGLMRYFKGHDIKALDPFAWYCWLAGAGSLALLLLR